MPGPVYIAGPTASGKSAAALLVAEQIGGEIISVDSMQVYRGMDIGSAKPSAADQARVPHHLIDVAEIDEPFDAARFVALARAAESAIVRRGRTPVYCGGTGLYFKALAAGLGRSPPADPGLRGSLEARPLPELLEELRHRDPETFERIDRSNPRRVIRAVEVLRLTGQKFSAQRADWPGSVQTGRWFGLDRERSDLRARIDARVDEMFARGLVEETRSLLERGMETNTSAMQALGCRQVAAFLRGEISLPAAIELVKQKTRQFAKRQMTWFRRQLELEWISAGAGADDHAVAAEILRRLASVSRSQPPATI